MSSIEGDEYEELRERLQSDPVFFADVVLDFKPFPYQAELLKSDSKRIVACWARQTGKTHTIAAKVIHFAFTRSDRTVIIVSRGLRQSMIMFSVIMGLINANPFLRRSVAKHTHTEVWLTNGSRIIALPCGPDGASLRGFTAHLVVMDEAAFMPEDVIASVIFPMLATTGGTSIMLSTPWGQDHIFYRSFKNPDYWSQHVRAEECPLISKEFLEGQRRNIGELQYRMEYEAEFVEGENSFFKQDLIRKCVEDYDYLQDMTPSMPGHLSKAYYLGADFGKRVDYSVVAVLEEQEDRVLKLVLLKQFALGTPYMDVVAFIQLLNEKFDIRKGFVDKSMVGESLVEEIKEFASQIEGLPFTAKVKQDMMVLLHARMEQKRILLPQERTLLSQINEQRQKFSKLRPTETPEEKGIVTFDHPRGTHDDQLWALALAVYAAKEAGPSVSIGDIRMG